MPALLKSPTTRTHPALPKEDYFAITTEFSQELIASALQRDRQAGMPELEIRRLRETGLLPLVVPQIYGGLGADWVTALQIVRQLSSADGSIGQLYGNHLNLVSANEMISTPAQAESYYRLTAQHHLFWAGAANSHAHLTLTPHGNCYRVNGIKSFYTGAVVADRLVVTAIQDQGNSPVLFVIPKGRKGVVYNYDWDNIGQRRTESLTFQDVVVYRDEILGPPPATRGAFASFSSVIAQLTKTCVYLGIVEGAFEAAIDYTTNQSHPWIGSGVDDISQDPYILRHYGDLWMKLQAAIALVERTTQQVQQAWNQGEQLTSIGRSAAAIAVSTAEVFVIKVGLEITNHIFDGMGDRSTDARLECDRYWRDLRTLSLLDPVDYKLCDIGNWVINLEPPTLSPYL